MTVALTRKAVWEETYRGIYPQEMLDDYDPKDFACRDEERIRSGNHHYYLFLDEGKCIGYFSFGPYNFGSYKDFSLCLNNLYIRKEYQGKGLGRQAFDCIREYCVRRGISKFFCGCNAHNAPAAGFYRHMGGVQGDAFVPHKQKSDDIIHFEFHIGERI